MHTYIHAHMTYLSAPGTPHLHQRYIHTYIQSYINAHTIYSSAPQLLRPHISIPGTHINAIHTYMHTRMTYLSLCGTHTHTPHTHTPHTHAHIHKKKHQDVARRAPLHVFAPPPKLPNTFSLLAGYDSFLLHPHARSIDAADNSPRIKSPNGKTSTHNARIIKTSPNVHTNASPQNARIKTSPKPHSKTSPNARIKTSPNVSLDLTTAQREGRLRTSPSSILSPISQTSSFTAADLSQTLSVDSESERDTRALRPPSCARGKLLSVLTCAFCVN